MERERIEQWAERNEVELLFADGFDDAIIGVGQQFNRHFVVYDESKCIEILMAQGMTGDVAREYYSFNVVDAWVGESTPAFVWTGD
jgi:hypothetical protein